MNPLTPEREYSEVETAGGADLVLVRQMATGDEGALAHFFDRWHGIVSAIVARVVRDADDVDDVVEEVFWQAWRQAGRYEPARGPVETWLFTIARTRALDRVRATRRRLEEPIGDAGAPFGTGLPADQHAAPDDPALDAALAERRRLVRAALCELPDEQRAALELAYFGGFSQSEIAERTGQPLGTVKTRMRLALQKLRAALDVLREDT